MGRWMVCADAADMVVCIACFDLSITPLLFWWLVESKEIILTDVWHLRSTRALGMELRVGAKSELGVYS